MQYGKYPRLWKCIRSRWITLFWIQRGQIDPCLNRLEILRFYLKNLAFLQFHINSPIDNESSLIEEPRSKRSSQTIRGIPRNSSLNIRGVKLIPVWRMRVKGIKFFVENIQIKLNFLMIWVYFVRVYFVWVYFVRVYFVRVYFVRVYYGM